MAAGPIGWLIPPPATRTRIELFQAYVDDYPSHSISKAVTVTQHPVEKGVPVADHSYVEPVQLTLQLIVSDMMNRQGKARRESDVVLAWQLFEKTMNDRGFVTVVTPLRRYENMIITSMSTSSEAGIGYSLHVDMSLQQVQLFTPDFTGSSGVIQAEDGEEFDFGGDTGQADVSAKDEDGNDVVIRMNFRWFGSLWYLSAKWAKETTDAGYVFVQILYDRPLYYDEPIIPEYDGFKGGFIATGGGSPGDPVGEHDIARNIANVKYDSTLTG